MGAPRPNSRGRSRVLLVAVGLFSTQVGGCFVSLDGLTGGDTPSNDHIEPQAPQAPQPSGTGGAGPTQDAGSSAPDEDAASDPADDADDGATLVSTDPPDSAPGSGGNTMVFGGPRVTSPTIGGDTGVGFSDSCPYGAALVGLNLVVDPSSPFALYQVQALCSRDRHRAVGRARLRRPSPPRERGRQRGNSRKPSLRPRQRRGRLVRERREVRSFNRSGVWTALRHAGRRRVRRQSGAEHADRSLRRLRREPRGGLPVSRPHGRELAGRHGRRRQLR